jgi:hypothetical protein
VKRLLAAAACAALVLLAGCGNSLSAGRVEAKSYHPGFWHEILLPVYGTRCTTEVIVTDTGSEEEEEDEDVCSQYVIRYSLVPQYVPASWQLKVKNGQTVAWVSVSEAVWGRTRTGSWWQS